MKPIQLNQNFMGSMNGQRLVLVRLLSRCVSMGRLLVLEQLMPPGIACLEEIGLNQTSPPVEMVSQSIFPSLINGDL